MPESAFLPRVTVVIPVRNCAATIRVCLDGVLAQTYPRALTEIIVVDNDSTDATSQIAASYPVTVVSEREIRTSYAARNRGVAHASGEVVAFTDGDCVPDPEWLARLVPPLADAGVGAVSGTVADAEPRSLCEEFTARVDPFARPERNGRKTLLTANVALRRSTLEAFGGFDERLPTGGDVDLGWRLQRQNLQLIEVAEARVSHRHRSTLRGVFAQYRRYGFSEMLLATLHRDASPSRAAAQVRAVASYVAGLLFRGTVCAYCGFDRRYLMWPLFLLVVETGNMTGKVEGWILTRGHRRNPFPNPRLART